MKLCTITEDGQRCWKKMHGHGMCIKHLQRWKKNGDPLIRGDHHRGERHHAAKLTEADVRKIRELWNFGMGWRQNALAEEYGVQPACINGIVNRRYWKHVA